jgi:hypothetical protein
VWPGSHERRTPGESRHLILLTGPIGRVAARA